nr:MAG TPA: hypothetical protein [Caudoviricetes sp.]
MQIKKPFRKGMTERKQKVENNKKKIIRKGIIQLRIKTNFT